MRKEVIIGILAVIVLVLVGFYVYSVGNRAAVENIVNPGSSTNTEVTKPPTPTVPLSGPEIQTSSKNITVTSPRPYEEVGLPLKIEGKARVFENMVSFRLKDNAGKMLVQDNVYANAPDTGQFGLFSKEINYPKPSAKEGILEIYQASAKDGSDTDKVSIPIIFKNVESLTVKVFLAHGEKGSNADCSKVFPVNRIIPKTTAVGRVVLQELIKGLTDQERTDGYSTTINAGTKIQNLTIKDKVATVDFSEDLQKNVGGSCMVGLIRAQIVETLKQFETVDSVVISINGRTEDILQP